MCTSPRRAPIVGLSTDQGTNFVSQIFGTGSLSHRSATDGPLPSVGGDQTGVSMWGQHQPADPPREGKSEQEKRKRSGVASVPDLPAVMNLRTPPKSLGCFQTKTSANAAGGRICFQFQLLSSGAHTVLHRSHMCCAGQDPQHPQHPVCLPSLILQTVPFPCPVPLSCPCCRLNP